MFGANIVSPTHLLLVLLVIVLVFGTKKLPELGRGLGSAMREFKGGISGTQTEPVEALEASDRSSQAAEQSASTIFQSR